MRKLGMSRLRMTALGIGTVRGTIPPGTPAGTYWICFQHTAGATATGVVSFTVT